MTRIEKIQTALKEKQLDAIVLFSPINIRYATQFFITDGAAVITQTKATLITDSRYIEAAQNQAVDTAVALFSDKGPTLEELVQALLEGCSRVGAEEKSTSYSKWNDWEKKLGRELVPAEQIFLDLRAIKEPGEVDCIITAQRIAEAALEEVLGLLKPGMTEREIAAELTYRMLRHGGEGNSFDPIAVTGTKTSMPHGVPGDEIVRTGDFVTMDFGCLYHGYCSDMTRTVAIGFATDEMRRIYDTVRSAQEAGIALARAGVTGAAVHNAGAQVIADAGYGAYFGHGFGHSLGLEIHEDPRASIKNTAPLPAGAVITAEPGIYIPGKFGVRIEDMLYLTETGCENLTKAPKDLLILS